MGKMVRIYGVHRADKHEGVGKPANTPKKSNKKVHREPKRKKGS
jgi:hypothetical protein